MFLAVVLFVVYSIFFGELVQLKIIIFQLRLFGFWFLWSFFGIESR